MPKYRISETVYYEVEAENEQEAMEEFEAGSGVEVDSSGGEIEYDVEDSADKDPIS